MKKLFSCFTAAAALCGTIHAGNLQSVADIARRAEQGEKLNVVFFGCSLTFGANSSNPDLTSYRGNMAEKLKAAYPLARWSFYDAAIGGTDSILGVFRLERDVLRFKPDLVFVDFTLNDNGRRHKDVNSAAYEKIIRTLLNSGAAVMPVFLTGKNFVTEPDLSVLLRRTEHIELAERFRLSYGDVIGEMNRLYKAGKLDPDKIWPAGRFDATHPNDLGYQYYADIIFDAFQAAARKKVAPVLPQELHGSGFRHTLRFRLADAAALPENWQVVDCETRAAAYDFTCSRWMGTLAAAGNFVRKGYDQFDLIKDPPAPESLTLCFKGQTILLFGESTFFSGTLRYAIDGKDRGIADTARMGKLFGSSAYYSIILASGLDPEKEHVLTLTPVLAPGIPQQVKIESVCVAGAFPVSVELENTKGRL